MMRPKLPLYAKYLILCFVIGLASAMLPGCVDTYNTISFQHLTSLKVYHEEFIGDYTRAPNREFNPEELKSDTAKGNSQFKEALEHSKTLEDVDRTNNFLILHSLYKQHASELQESGAFFSELFAKEKLIQVEQGYKEAIEGENARDGAPK